jgi:hypothetical protein
MLHAKPAMNAIVVQLLVDLSSARSGEQRFGSRVMTPVCESIITLPSDDTDLAKTIAVSVWSDNPLNNKVGCRRIVSLILGGSAN